MKLDFSIKEQKQFSQLPFPEPPCGSEEAAEEFKKDIDSAAVSKTKEHIRPLRKDTSSSYYAGYNCLDWNVPDETCINDMESLNETKPIKSTVNDGGKDTMDNGQGEAEHSEYEYKSSLNEMYMSNDESFEALKAIPPPGSVVYEERLVSYNRKTYCLRYEYIIYNDPVKHEGASSDPQVTKHETYNGAEIEEEDTPKTSPFVNEDQQVAIQAMITGVNIKRRDNIGNQEGDEHDEIYTNEDSIETLKFIRPAGNVILPSQNSYFLEDPDQLEYEEALLELQITEDEKYSRADIRDYDSP